MKNFPLTSWQERLSGVLCPSCPLAGWQVLAHRQVLLLLLPLLDQVMGIVLQICKSEPHPWQELGAHIWVYDILVLALSSSYLKSRKLYFGLSLWFFSFTAYTKPCAPRGRGLTCSCVGQAAIRWLQSIHSNRFCTGNMWVAPILAACALGQWRKQLPVESQLICCKG